MFGLELSGLVADRPHDNRYEDGDTSTGVAALDYTDWAMPEEEPMERTIQHATALRLAELIERAPAGGLFHDVILTPPVTIEGGPSRFHVLLRNGERVEVQVTPLEKRPEPIDWSAVC